jgi:hypothetical protein
MDSQQAKQILLGYHPGSADASDPQIAEALRQLEHDPQLALWFEQLQRADDAIRRQLRETPVPHDLKQRILAEQKIVRPDFGWRKPVLMAAAAATIIALGVLTVWVSRRDTRNGLEAYRADMVRYVSSSYSSTFIKATSFDELRQVLASRKWPSDFIIPDRLRSVTVIGGGAVEWNGHKVALACMKEGRHGLWLFVMEKSALRDAPQTETPRIKEVESAPTAAWSQDGNAYLFTVQGDETLLKKYLPPTGS